MNPGALATDLGGLALEVAIEGGRAEQVLTWAERTRAAALRRPALRPPADPDLAARLVELRALDKELERAAVEGEDTAGVLRRKAALEDAVRHRTWRACPTRTDKAEPAPTFSLRDLGGALADRVLVEYVESGGTLLAVTVRDGRTRLWDMGPVKAIDCEVDALRFALNRLAAAAATASGIGACAGPGAGSHPATLAGMWTAAAARLDRALFGNAGSVVEDRPLVLVPTGPLHRVPWAALPSCRGRPVSVSPSAATWVRTVSAPFPSPAGRQVLAAGPGVPHARQELDVLARIYPCAERLDGVSATARAVTAALDGAGLTHVVAHGSFRADNPLFSSLRMSDGPLTAYDLEALSSAPRRIVLSACDGGLAAVRPGNELLGLSAALFSLGTTTLVASVQLIGDGQTCGLMVDFHRRLAGGAEPAAALAQAQAAVDPGDLRAVATATSFVCLGA